MISIIANIIGTIGKANQKKKPMPSSAKKTKNADHKDRNMAPEANLQYSSGFEYDNRTVLQGASWDDNRSNSYRAAEENPIENESLGGLEETYDAGLSELQHAIIMSEVLDKPLALRRR